MSTEQCPNCLKQIPQYATRCPYCTTWFDEPIGTVHSEPEGPIGAFFAILAIGMIFYLPIVIGSVVVGYFVEWITKGQIPFAGFLTAIGGLMANATFSVLDKDHVRDKENWVKDIFNRIMYPAEVLIIGPIFVGGILIMLWQWLY